MVKNPPAVMETQVNSWVRKIPWRREWLPTPVFLPEEFHGQRNLEGYSPWGHKESSTTEHTRISLGNHYSAYHRGKLESIVFLGPDVTKRRK